MRFNPEIFRLYDIRGIYSKDFDEEFAFVLGRAVVKHFKAKKILVARDSRVFSERLTEALIQGACAIGCDAGDIGLATTPFFNFVLSKIKPDVGVIITASHNPPEYGGFKVYSKTGEIIGLSSGLAEINKIIENGMNEPARTEGKKNMINTAKFMQDYIKDIISKSKVRGSELKGIKIKITGPKTVLSEIELLSEKLELSSDESVYDIGFSFDEDSDRLIVTDSAGNRIGNDFIVGILAKNSVRFLSKPRVIYDVHFSRGVINKFKEWGIKSYISKIGRFYLKDAMVKHRADIGGEISGHIYFKDNNRNELPLLAMLKLLKIMVLSKMSVGEIIKPFQTWFNSGRRDFTVKDRESVERLLSEIEKHYQDGQIDKLDGITIDYTDPEKTGGIEPEKYWWFNVRASNTEPVVRLLIEAKNQEVLDQKVKEISEIVSRYK